MNKYIGFRALIYREILRFIKVFNQTIIPPLVSALLYMFIFGIALGSRLSQVMETSYINFIVPGLVMMNLIESAYANTSSSFYIARWHNHIQEILVSPLSYMEMVLAILIGGLVRSAIVAACVFTLSLLFTWTGIAHPWVILFFVVGVSLIFSLLGLLVGLMAESWEHLSIWSTFLLTPLIFLGGVFHSIALMPDFIRRISLFNPIYYMIEGMRFGFLGTHACPLWMSITVVLTMVAALFMLTVYLFKIGYKLRT
ncbi:MAG: ABC transporter permease [Chlamydiota bacterium]|nr:ABC transporter permease [Chlamydiota bacterium]